MLVDPQKRYYVVIDDLDKGWAEEQLRYKLVMALIETVREFIRVRNAKVVVALRRDLIDRVFRITRGSGFQEEKYASLYLPLTWTKPQIIDLLDRRINKLVRRRYAKKSVTHKDLLPKQHRAKPISAYVFAVAQRPRDVIAFFNACILAAVDQPKLTAKELKLAEGEYSRGRLRALADEWSDSYPSLIDYARILNGQRASCSIEDIVDDAIIDVCFDVAAAHPARDGELRSLGYKVVEGDLEPSAFVFDAIRVFYTVGLVGLKLAPHDTESWVDEAGRSISRAELSRTTTVVVHPAFRRALGIMDK